jgi:hypothetical protein
MTIKSSTISTISWNYSWRRGRDSVATESEIEFVEKNAYSQRPHEGVIRGRTLQNSLAIFECGDFAGISYATSCIVGHLVATDAR